MMKANLLFGIFVIVLLLGSEAIGQKCLRYAPTLKFSGTLHSRVFAGPPNYESIRHGDRKETAILLRLAKPICIAAGDPTERS